MGSRYSQTSAGSTASGGAIRGFTAESAGGRAGKSGIDAGTPQRRYGGLGPCDVTADGEDGHGGQRLAVEEFEGVADVVHEQLQFGGGIGSVDVVEADVDGDGMPEEALLDEDDLRVAVAQAYEHGHVGGVAKKIGPCLNDGFGVEHYAGGSGLDVEGEGAELIGARGGDGAAAFTIACGAGAPGDLHAVGGQRQERLGLHSDYGGQLVIADGGHVDAIEGDVGGVEAEDAGGCSAVAGRRDGGGHDAFDEGFEVGGTAVVGGFPDEARAGGVFLHHDGPVGSVRAVACGDRDDRG